MSVTIKQAESFAHTVVNLLLKDIYTNLTNGCTSMR